jgi:hypothetical protein
MTATERQQSGIVFFVHKKKMGNDEQRHNIPQTLRTGLLGESESPHLAALQRRLVSLVTALVTRASSSAAVYAEHARQQDISASHVMMALRYECRRFLEGDLESFMQETEAIESKLDAILNSMGYESFDGFLEEAQRQEDETDDEEANNEGEGSEEEEEEEEEEEAEEEETDAAETNYQCTCPMCCGIRHVNDTWSTWQPTDPLELFLKDKTDATFEKIFGAM